MSSLDSLVNFVADKRHPFTQRIEAMQTFPGLSQHLIFRKADLPDLRYPLKILSSIAADPDEFFPLRRAVIEQGIVEIIRDSSVFFAKAKEKTKDFPAVTEIFQKALQDNIGNPDTILSTLLDVSGNDQNPFNLRQLSMATIPPIREAFNGMEMPHDKSQVLAQRFAHLQTLIPALE